MLLAQLFADAPDAGVAWGAIVLAVVTSFTSLITLALNLRHDKKITQLQQRNDQCEADREQDRVKQTDLANRLARHERLARRRRKKSREQLRRKFDELQGQLAQKKDATDGHQPLPSPAP